MPVPCASTATETAAGASGAVKSKVGWVITLNAALWQALGGRPPQQSGWCFEKVKDAMLESIPFGHKPCGTLKAVLWELEGGFPFATSGTDVCCWEKALQSACLCAIAGSEAAKNAKADAVLHKLLAGKTQCCAQCSSNTHIPTCTS